jgi:uncharacterized protein
MHGPPSTEQAIESLCRVCALCCNGVLFRDVELQPGDPTERLRLLGLPLQTPRTGRAKQQSSVETPVPIRNLKFTQPCPALGVDLRCRLYADRPKYCHAFECALLKAVVAGRVSKSTARRIIRTTLRSAGRVGRLLRQLGDTEETLALDLRFRRMLRRVHSRSLGTGTAALCGELSLAMHDLNLLLRREFYPAPGD